MDTTRLNNLLFLLSATSVGCFSPTDDPDTAGGSTSTSMSTTNAATSATASSDGADSGASTSSTATATSGADASSEAGTTAGSGDCGDYGVHIADCFYGGDPAEAANIAAYCAYELAYLTVTGGVACGVSFEELVACVSSADCGEIEDASACPDEVAAVQTNCQ